MPILFPFFRKSVLAACALAMCVSAIAAPKTICTITDTNITNNTCTCQ